jgi:hypothetical protein
MISELSLEVPEIISRKVPHSFAAGAALLDLLNSLEMRGRLTA